MSIILCLAAGVLFGWFLHEGRTLDGKSEAGELRYRLGFERGRNDALESR